MKKETLEGATAFYYDYCKTIYRKNTTIDFLKFLSGEAKSKSIRIKYYLFWVAAKLLKDLRLIDKGSYLTIRLKTLKGLDKEFLESYGAKYVASLDRNYRINEVLSEIEELLKLDKKIVIISNSILEVVLPFAKEKSIEEVYCSKLEYVNGKSTGRFSFDMKKNGKLNFMKSITNMEEIKGAYFATDDIEADFDLYNVTKFKKHVQ